MFDPGPDYTNVPSIWVPERREYQCREEGGEGIGNLTNSSFIDLGLSDLGRIINISPSISRINRLIPNVTTAYLNNLHQMTRHLSLDIPSPLILGEEITLIWTQHFCIMCCGGGASTSIGVWLCWSPR